MTSNHVSRSLRGGVKPKAGVLEAGRFDIRAVATVYKMLPVELLRPGMFQTRRTFNKRKLAELSASLLASGTNITPLVVRPIKNGTEYEIICGERRWRGGQLGGMESLLCCIGDFDDDQAMYISGVDNLQREDLNPLEEAHAYSLLLNTGLSQESVAKDIGKSRSHVSQFIRLLSLPLAVRDMLSDGRLNFAQARPLCTLTSVNQQIDIARDAVDKKWSSKTIEARVAKELEKKKPSARLPDGGDDVNVERLAAMVSVQTGYPCAIKKTKETKETKGTWTILLQAGSADEFNGILERLSINTEDL
ncbi:ParB/RepB/Spo0J family partition protein [Pseudomonas syringae]|uniref:ParB/RepB/Spo0J family partition protein n=1 Tax=Pseudomonas syringae TaxID=317 RepID=UPI001F2F3DE0|nr:ParB/RepB/Spo0J family partition protein [Pseudomonas syringae]MCF5382089.1 ParB/RepB/Spo0J family partition protein [Pseudomonas syringae]MCF5419327.1 ParB/RepB/Spo0J family partition protein [Pseudomonas syringae]MCF5454457.1 ParB/RepB/Spo0J family partition protein [Pseudomonas syringae]MCF5458417.1 ParB/RepB/Spo0J family partition protein [Pseudomonas syringae]